MLILSKSRFLKTPYVAPLWFTKTLEQVMKDTNCQMGRVLHQMPYLPWSMAPGRGIFTFAFVRNPFDWYRAYYVKALHSSWSDTNVDPLLRSATFQGFIDNLLIQSPGLATEVFKQITGDFTIDFIGKYEELQKDLATALQRANERVPETWPEIDPSETTTILQGYDLSYRHDQEETVFLADAESFKTFGYNRNSEWH